MKERLIQLLRQQPFRPFVVELSNGRRYEIRHPEMAALLKSSLVISHPDSDELELCSLLHIANITANGPISPETEPSGYE